MANTFPCNQIPIRFVNCCQVMDCIDIKSSDNSISVEKSECGIDLTITGNNLDNILQVNDGECITWVKEFIGGKLHLTPVIDWACVAAQVCEICNPPTCPAPIALVVSPVDEDEDFLLINSGDNLQINNLDNFLI